MTATPPRSYVPVDSHVQFTGYKNREAEHVRRFEVGRVLRVVEKSRPKRGEISYSCVAMADYPKYISNPASVVCEPLSRCEFLIPEGVIK